MNFLCVNLTSGSIAEEQIPKRYTDLGGCGLTSIMVNDRVPADCDSLGEDNLLVFDPGFLSGTSLLYASKSSQLHMAATDSAGLCMFAQPGGMDNLFSALSALTGEPFGSEEWQQLGMQILTAEIDFNRRTGLTEEDDRLPDMSHKEPLSPYHRTVPYLENYLPGTFAAIGQTLEERK